MTYPGMRTQFDYPARQRESYERSAAQRSLIRRAFALAKDNPHFNPNTEVEDCYLWGAHSSRVLAEAARLSELGAVLPILLGLHPLPVRHKKGRCSGPLQPTRGTHVLPGKESSAAGSSPYPASEFRFKDVGSHGSSPSPVGSESSSRSLSPGGGTGNPIRAQKGSESGFGAQQSEIV